MGLVRWYGGATEFEPAAPPVDTRRIFCAYRASPARVSRAQGQRDYAKRAVRELFCGFE